MTCKTFPVDLALCTYYDYDTRSGRLALLRSVGPSVSTLVNYFAYQRDANGEITWIRHEGDQNTYYEYDGLGRLTLEERKDTSTTLYGFRYAYDAASNRTRKVTIHESNARTYYTYDVRNLMAREWIDGGAAAYYAHDQAQRMTSRTVTGTGQSAYFSHDQHDRVSVVAFAKASSPDYDQDFLYNGLGERVWLDRTIPQPFGDPPILETTKVAYDGSKILNERDLSGTEIRTYRHNDLAEDRRRGSLLEVQPAGGGQRLYPSFDHQGTARSMKSQSMELTNSYLFDFFGVQLNAAEATTANPRQRFVTPALISLDLVNQQMGLLGEGRLYLPGPAMTGDGAGRAPAPWSRYDKPPHEAMRIEDGAPFNAVSLLLRRLRANDGLLLPAPVDKTPPTEPRSDDDEKRLRLFLRLLVLMAATGTPIQSQTNGPPTVPPPSAPPLAPPAWAAGLKPCPCKEPGSGTPSTMNDGWAKEASHKSFHLGAKACYRSYPILGALGYLWRRGKVLAGQQCCYDNFGDLITAGSSAGTPDQVGTTYGEDRSGRAPLYDPFVVGWLDLIAHGIIDVYPYDKSNSYPYRLLWPPNNANGCPYNYVNWHRGTVTQVKPIVTRPGFTLITFRSEPGEPIPGMPDRFIRW